MKPVNMYVVNSLLCIAMVSAANFPFGGAAPISTCVLVYVSKLNYIRANSKGVVDVGWWGVLPPATSAASGYLGT